MQRAALILQVSDATSPIRQEQEAQVEKVLQELGSEKKPRLRVVNKIDALTSKEREHLRDDAHTVHVSALQGLGLGTLLDRIDQALEEDPLRQVHLQVPQSEGKALAMLEAGARIYSRQYRDGVVELEAQAPESVMRKVRKFIVG